MRLWLRALCAVCFALLIPTCVSFGTEGQSQATEQEVKAVEQRWLENEDRPEVVQTILADDFVHVLPIGFISKDDQLSYLRQHPNAFPGTKHFEELRVRIYGDVAIANGIFSTIRDPQSKPTRTAFTDVFVRRGGKWLAVNAQELPLEPGSKAGS
ncbi:MAG TPA: nuclear transport factor 2 family protein [Terriglobales bacterium]|nr:nuclear transport factor 2 family protein [Terriglobales bacterium]